jgi:hypothetical protein
MYKYIKCQKTHQAMYFPSNNPISSGIVDNTPDSIEDASNNTLYFYIFLFMGILLLSDSIEDASNNALYYYIFLPMGILLLSFSIYNSHFFTPEFNMIICCIVILLDRLRKTHNQQDAR